ncbi:MAG: rhodanese-like domain-containing protein [Tabrizicola sp.]|nr:rhodanese-like domain-containing protein [Tabrizicola sp.]
MPSRRVVILAALLAAGTLGAGYAWFEPTFAGPSLHAPAVFKRLEAGEITLIDIRRPDEWEETGTAKGALRLDMRRRDFVQALDALVDGDRTRPIAVICARGVRSARMSDLLTENGFSNIINVPEGMLGSSAGPGWIARGLPVTAN